MSAQLKWLKDSLTNDIALYQRKLDSAKQMQETERAWCYAGKLVVCKEYLEVVEALIISAEQSVENEVKK